MIIALTGLLGALAAGGGGGGTVVPPLVNQTINLEVREFFLCFSKLSEHLAYYIDISKEIWSYLFCYLSQKKIFVS